jgi:hypothetical protein
MTMTVKDLIEALNKMPPDARVVLMGSYETYDGYSHPSVELDADGEVVICEAAEPEYDGQPSEMEEWHSFDPDC